MARSNGSYASPGCRREYRWRELTRSSFARTIVRSRGIQSRTADGLREPSASIALLGRNASHVTVARRGWAPQGLHAVSGRRAAHLRVGMQGAAHSSGRHACWERFRRQVRREHGSSRSTAKSRDIQSTTSDRDQPSARPRNLSFLGNRPIRLNPVRIHRGLLISRATSCELSSSLEEG